MRRHSASLAWGRARVVFVATMPEICRGSTSSKISSSASQARSGETLTRIGRRGSRVEASVRLLVTRHSTLDTFMVLLTRHSTLDTFRLDLLNGRQYLIQRS